MASTYHPYRSVLYMPGSNARALQKARTLAADALILDLEDAVAPGEKAEARELVAGAVERGSYGARKVIVRINALDTEWGPDDLARTAAAGPDAILLPKVETAANVVELAERMRAVGAPDATAIWAMMETPRGVLNAAAIAGAHDRLAGLVLGTNDLGHELRVEPTPDRLPLVTSLSLCVLAARAHGLVCVDGVYNAFRDADGLRAACVQGRALGFDGKTLIHPAQIDVANEVFAPSDDDLAAARRQLEAFQAATARGEGVAVVDGRIVENLHAETARRRIGQAEAIARRAAERA